MEGSAHLLAAAEAQGEVAGRIGEKAAAFDGQDSGSGEGAECSDVGIRGSRSAAADLPRRSCLGASASIGRADDSSRNKETTALRNTDPDTMTRREAIMRRSVEERKNCARRDKTEIRRRGRGWMNERGIVDTMTQCTVTL